MKNRLKQRIFALSLLAWTAVCPADAQQTRSLREQFQNPSDEAKPWTFWYWMYGVVSKEGITADLEAMKHAGLGGTYLMPIKGIHEGVQYDGKAQQLTPEWWEMVRFSMEEADRLGLKLGMHICDGFALAGGPWITPKESMQKVVWSDTIVDGGKLNALRLPQPEAYENYYEDIALFALPVEDAADEMPAKITCVNLATANNVKSAQTVNMDAAGIIRSSYPCYIQYEYKQAFTCRNIEIVLNGNNYQAHRLKVMASDDGVNYRFVKQLVPVRQGWQNTDENSTHSIPATTARYFRFYWTPEGSEPGSEDMDAAKWKPNLKIKQLRLHQEARLNQWEGKAGLVWRVAESTREEEIGKEDCYSLSQVINLTEQYKNAPASHSKEKTITAVLPKGKWKLLRMGHTATGHTNATGGGGKGLECDKFNPRTVRKQFDNWFAQAFVKTHPEVARRVLKYMHVDSWECGSQNWSDSFAKEFRTRRGYDLLPYLPLLAGIPMESAGRSEEILRDVRTTIAELVVDVFYQVLSDCAKEYDCQFSAECVAPTMVSDGLLHYQKVDLPMGEFWLNSPTHDKPNDMLDAISGAHIYGKNIIQAEGFTEVRGTWDEYPAMLKALLDRNYALGINRLFYHVYVHNPWLDRQPGMTLDGIGLFFQRNQTWWDKGAKAFSEYATRCQSLLQYGHPVTDIAVFTGEEVPRRSVLPERLVSSLPGLFGTERIESERIRLANEGQPLRVRPVGVTHSANMADPEKWVNPLRGYAYDSFNKDALLRLAKAENGRMKLAEGMGYKVVVLPLSRPMNPEPVLSPAVRKKMDELKAAGVIVPALPYTEEDFSAYGLERDMIVPEDVAWMHRSGELGDIYFVANQREETRTFTASMRINGRKPECWNPVTGEMNTHPSYRIHDNRTEVTLTLAPNESVFIVFPTEEAADKERTSTDKREPLNRTLETEEYTVTFLATGKTVVRKDLFDWSKEEDEQIRYYSGTAVYKATFRWKDKLKKGQPVYLNLGKVCNLATVRVNGIDCGTVWTAPYRADITSALKKGTNELEIEVTNTWANALKGVDEGKAPYDGIWTNAKYRKQEDTLLPAGLLGILTIEN
ncbi:glycosyl hydrolase [Bacteroides finegoldii]|uniref:Glycosyl hydrolases family 2, sugar binding domain n=1 Tax=Bacteroides finegoldii TaxID=338188 RepID=A0A174FJF9_9BACE|nr:glycosyl hydrolase [Bacteroides finegoldii]MCG4683737.1 DNA-binding protein [Bacteroides finegoldii]CDC50751.1 sugar binding domain protein glycosyl hydrolase family 2 [Bacteroides finegoldii CAG:203]CUO48590.1 Glycosyl hydrolases family 2%2C sugar binding domain [Bacteroides finegoldii]